MSKLDTIVQVQSRVSAPNTTRLLTLTEVAQRLAVSLSTVRRLTRAGGLPAYRVGGQLRVRASELEQFVERSRLGDRRDRERT
jgi:excisionase family DNA binding protein